MKRKIFLTVLVILITIINILLFKDFYNSKNAINNTKIENEILI